MHYWPLATIRHIKSGHITACFDSPDFQACAAQHAALHAPLGRLHGCGPWFHGPPRMGTRLQKSMLCTAWMPAWMPGCSSCPGQSHPPRAHASHHPPMLMHQPSHVDFIVPLVAGGCEASGQGVPRQGCDARWAAQRAHHMPPNAQNARTLPWSGSVCMPCVTVCRSLLHCCCFWLQATLR